MDYTISLYYVEGINDVDTPFFLSKAEQSEYFNKSLVKTLSTSYYPPYYRNTIKFASDDLTLETKVNYLSLDTDERKYYYFITSAMYISEGILEVTIAMDVIQTYFFDFEIRNCVIERKFINRYNADGTFNRNYIRENVSRGNFIKGETHYYDNLTGWYLIRINKAQSSLANFTYGDNKKRVLSDGTFAIVPEDMDAFTNVTKNQPPVSMSKADIVMWCMASESYTECISYIPFDCFQNHYTTEVYNASGTDGELGGKLVYVFDDTYYSQIESTSSTKCEIIVHKNKNYATADTNITNIRYPWVTIGTYIIDSYKNTETNVHFHTDFAPVLIDECYQNLFFGENSCYTACALRMTKTPAITFRAMADLDTFNRVYGYTFEGYESIDKPSFNSVVSTNASLDITLIASSIRTWFAQNKAGFIGGLINSSFK